jgi:hypothetical protein
MFWGSTKTWPLTARILWIVALIIDVLVATTGIVVAIRHMDLPLLRGAMAILAIIATGCQIIALDRGKSKLTGNQENSWLRKQ